MLPIHEGIFIDVPSLMAQFSDALALNTGPEG
jgi:hypothetical protein